MAKNKKVSNIEEERSKRKITITNSKLELLNSTESLTTVSQSKRLPVEFLFSLRKLKIQLVPLMKAYLEQKFELINTFGDKDDQGQLIQLENGRYTFSGNNGAKFAEELQKLMFIENTIECKKPKLKQKDIPNGLLSEEDFEVLDCVIDFEEK